MPTKDAFCWLNPKLKVKKTGKYGKGIFATQPIKKDELLAIMGGYIFTRAEEDALSSGMNDYGLQISEEFVIGAKKLSDVAGDDYFNHSCEPNSGFKGQILLVAMKKIPEKTEVTFDYGMVLYPSKNAKRYRIDCLCGARKCRKTVTDNDWMLPELQRRYDGYFQWFLQDKINRKAFVSRTR
jgi:SET domain-containing protein